MVMKSAMILALLALASGCATVYEGKYDYERGWRSGTVLDSGLGTARFASAGVDCRSEFPRKAIAEHRFAFVQFVFVSTAGKYFYGGPKQRNAIALIPDGVAIKAGDRVYVDIHHCRQPVAQMANP